jgi:predicted methyltransferase
MDTILSDIAASFDVRASTYNKNDWHRLCAEQLVAFCEIGSGQSVLDAGTGTGFAAIAAARAVGPQGRVVGHRCVAGHASCRERSHGGSDCRGDPVGAAQCGGPACLRQRHL